LRYDRNDVLSIRPPLKYWPKPVRRAAAITSTSLPVRDDLVGQSAGVDGADAGGSAGDQCGTFTA
jgi:hypothetical protein